MGKLTRFLDRKLLSGSCGMTLPEVMVSVGITSIVIYFAFNLLTDFSRRAWEHEAKSKAIDERELAANIIKKELTQFITSVTGPYGEVSPSNFWTCTSSSCVMNIVYKHKDIDGNPASTPLNPPPLQAECVNITDARLATAGVGLHSKANGSLGAAKCLQCPVGKAPRITLNLYSFDAASGAPTLSGTRNFPEEVGVMSRQGSLAMGLCVDWPAYAYNVGTAATPLNVNRYDRWSVTLIPVFSRYAQRGGMTESEIAASLSTVGSKILVSPTRRLAPDFRFTPVK